MNNLFILPSENNTVYMEIVYTLDFNLHKKTIRSFLSYMMSNHSDLILDEFKFKENLDYLYGLKLNVKSRHNYPTWEIIFSLTFPSSKFISDPNYEKELLEFISSTFINRKSIDEKIFTKNYQDELDFFKFLDRKITDMGKTNALKLLLKDHNELPFNYENTKNITYELLLDELKNLNENSNLNIFLYGQMSNYFTDEIKNLSSLKPYENHQSELRYYLLNKNEQLVVEETNKFNQTYITLVYEFPKFDNIHLFENFTYVVHDLLSSNNGYLFNEIREKHQYCYAVYSEYSTNSFAINAIVNTDEYLKAIDDIEALVLSLQQASEYKNLQYSKDKQFKLMTQELITGKSPLVRYKSQTFYNDYLTKEEYEAIYEQIDFESIKQFFKSFKLIQKYALVGIGN